MLGRDFAVQIHVTQKPSVRACLLLCNETDSASHHSYFPWNGRLHAVLTTGGGISRVEKKPDMRLRLLSNAGTYPRLNAGAKGLMTTRPVEASSAPIGGEKKRFLDIGFAASSLVFFLPLFGLIALLIKCSDAGPVLYRHWRIGHAGRPFECLKFRTMVLHGDEVLRRHLAELPDASSEWNETRKLKGDPRVTFIGAVLRKLSLDELPQLINILRGEMSIVGPRPIVSDEVRMYGENAELYFKARPGLTGLWQISGRNDKSYSERVALDCTYVSSWSLGTDLMIIMKSIPAVLTLRGSY